MGIKSKIPYLVMAVLALAIAGLLIYIIPYRYRLNRTVEFEENHKALDNPLTGYAPPAENVGECQDSRLVYIGLTWDMWEPSPGVYNTDMLEETYHISRWKEENKHAVLRFLCDVPGDERHMDIPQWLYEKTGDGEYYNTGYGAGYCPNYENLYFQERHSLAVEALAEYCNEDDFVAYVELGSLGHWGEWHTNTDEGVPPMPDAEVCWNYVLDYSDNFHNARLLMRRNYVMASEGNMGLYNDMTGSREDTEEWMEWIRRGGSFETSGRPLEYVPMEEFWQQAPCGGEFTSSQSMGKMLGEDMEDTIDMVRRLHMTFLGPHCPEGSEKDGSAARALREEMGYRYYISQLDTRYMFGQDHLEVKLTWENSGIAPLYWDWPVTMYVYDSAGELLYWDDVDISLSRLLPGEKMETVNEIPFTDQLRKGYRIGIGITDPDEKEHIFLGQNGEIKDGVQMLYTYE
ncbi:MAG: DUF4832 domain-containing protein [Ruminococcus sp.]|jgi:hypothetical protein